MELPSRGNAELRVHLAEMPFHGAEAEKELCTDLAVGAPVPGQPSVVLLLCSEVVAGADLTLVDLLARGPQLSACALRERLGTDGGKAVVRGAELEAGVAEVSARDARRGGEAGR